MTTIQNFVGAILVDLDKRLLLIKEEDTNNIGLGRWNLPGGRVEPNESLEKAIEREVKEETGYKSEVNQLIGIYLVQKDNLFWNYFVYKVTAIRWNTEEVTDPDVSMAYWFTDSELEALDEEEMVHPDMRMLYKNVIAGAPISVNKAKWIQY